MTPHDVRPHLGVKKRHGEGNQAHAGDGGVEGFGHDVISVGGVSSDSLWGQTHRANDRKPSLQFVHASGHAGCAAENVASPATRAGAPRKRRWRW